MTTLPNPQTPVVAVVMGSASDYGVIKSAASILAEFEIPHKVRVISTHRTPDVAHAFCAGAKDRGLKLIIAAAGKAAHLAGVMAASTTIPVIGVPMKTSDLGGLDSLLSMVQMPAGKLEEYRRKMAEEVKQAHERIREGRDA